MADMTSQNLTGVDVQTILCSTSDPVQVQQAPRLPRESSEERQSVHQTPCRRSKSHACHAKATAEQRRPRSAKAYIRPRAGAASPTPATRKQRQSSRDQGAPKRTSDPVQMQQIPRLPRESSGRAAETKERQSVHQTPCKRSKSHACHAKAAAEQRRPRSAKAYIRPRADAASPAPATRKQRQSSGDQGAPKRTSDAGAASPTAATRKQRHSSGDQGAPKRTSDPAQVQQAPRLPRESSGRAAETKERQSVHQTPRRRSKSHACHAKAAAEQRRPRSAKAYIRPRANAASPTPATRKQRQSSGDQGAPKRTSDPAQMQQVPRLPRESSGRAAETKERQSVHQTPCRCSKPHACHAKVAAQQRRPRSAKAYIRPRAGAASPTPATRKQRQSSGDQGAPKRTSDPVQQRRPRSAKAYIRPRAGAASPTPATRKQRQSSGDQGAPKRTSDPAQMQQVPRLPRESSGRAAETKERQSVHQTPCRCNKSHACHAKAAAEQRRPRSAKAYIRPRAGAASPTPATRKQRQSSGDQGAPKRTSDPVQMQQVPRLPRESSGRAAETKGRQSVHQTPCRCSKSHACHAKAAAEQRRPRSAKAYMRPRAGAASPTPATRKQRQSSGDQGAPKRTSDPAQMQQVPRLPRESSGRAAETKDRQSVHQTPRRCSKPHACHAKAAAEQRRPRSAKAYIRPRAGAASPTPATRKQRQSSGDKERQSVHQTPCRRSKSHAWHQTLSSCVMSNCVTSSCVMSTCVMSTCVMSSSVMWSYVMCVLCCCCVCVLML